MKVLEFANWIDLQTQQIILVPRLDEHGALLSSSSMEKSQILHQINDTNVYDWSLEDILELLKKQTPIALHVMDDDSTTATKTAKQAEMDEEKKDCDDTVSSLTLPFSPMSELSSWTKRVVNETSKQVNKYKLQQQQKQQLQLQQQQQQENAVVSIYIQSNTGAFLPLTNCSQQQEITNTSLLVIRKSATEPAGNDLACQWYASSSLNNDNNGTAWRKLEGATHTAFQPSAVLAGYFLRCVIQIDNATILCQTEKTVQIVPTLFQGIHHASKKIEGYSSICVINDVTFRLSITSASEGCSAVRVERVLEGPSTEVIHERLVGVKAYLKSYDKPKEFQLILPLDDNTDSLLYQLSDQSRVVTCQALNRLGRESFLIALGITNFSGKPSSCHPSTLLYSPSCTEDASIPAPATTPPALLLSLPPPLPPNQPVSESTTTNDKHSLSTTPPRSPYSFQRSTSLDMHTHSVHTQQQFSELQQENAELQKQNKQWLNEKAILQAAIDARENKIEHFMQELAQAKAQLEAHEQTENERQERKVIELQDVIKQLQTELQEKDALILAVQTECKTLEEKYQQGQAVVEAHQQEHSALTMKLQKLKAERCHFKQKNDSLQKEIAIICKNGRTIRQVEKIISDDAARQQEVLLLRQQKKDALTELEHYRTAYQETKHAQKMAGLDVDVTRLLERNAELERLVSELTEFVAAKESQLETVKQINEALQTEIHGLAQANMNKNDV